MLDVKHGFAFKGEHFVDSGDFVLLTPGNCYEGGGLKLKGDKEKYYNGDFPVEYLLNEGDLIVVMTDLVNTAPVLGGAFIIPESGRFLHNQRLGLIQVTNEKHIHRDFLYYLLNSRNYRAQVRGSASGATVRHTSPGRIKNCTAKIPTDLKQQRHIANVLGAYDELIQNNRQRISLLEESTRLLFIEWFVRLRFPGHERVDRTKGIPTGWHKVPLGKITTKIGSGATPRGGESAYVTEGVTLIRSMNVYDDRFVDDGLAFIDEEQAAALDNVAVQPRDILLNITGASVARCCMAPERYLPARVNQHVMIIRPEPAKADPFFVHASINSDERKRQLLGYAQKGSTREALTKEVISAFEITLPSEELMRQFGEIAEPAFRQRELLAEQNQKLRAARDHLLPRLMSGQIEV